MTLRCLLFLLPFVLLPALLAAQPQTYTLELTVVDLADERPLSFVSVQLFPGNLGGQTDEGGKVILRAPRGGYLLRASYTGYAPFAEEILLRDDLEATLRLEQAAAQLETVTVTERNSQLALRRPTMGVERLSADDIARIPTVLGERDVLRSIQLLAGVSSAGEASNGVSVRGGTIDQNLLLYDGAPVFTPTHLFGLFSVFTPDAVSGIDLYRGNIPARYGGRIASVLDVRSKSPGRDRTEIRGGIGLVSSHLTLETPLDKGKRLGLLASGRFSFSDFLFPIVERLKNTESRFADATVKLQYRPGDRDIFTLTGFYSQDFYQLDLLSNIGGVPAIANQYAYLTLNGGAEWLRILDDRWSVRSEIQRAGYDPELRFPQRDGNRVDFLSTIRYLIGRSALTFEGEDHRATAGVQYDRYTLAPGRLDPGGASAILPISLAEERGSELAVFAEDEWTVSDRLTLSAGLRYVHYRQLGPGEQRLYREGEVVRESSLLETIALEEAELRDYNGLEPRLGVVYAIDDQTSLKASYARSRQYLQNIFNATTPVPTSRWKVSDNNVGPQTGNLYSLGLSRATADRKYFFQLESYYRGVDDLLEYRPGADFFLNPAVETDLVRGRGRGYGVELTARRETGRISGEVNYAYARVENLVDGPTPDTRINRGDWYPGYFDQPHTFNARLTLDEGRTHELGLNLVVQSNRPYTVPNGFVTIGATPVPLFLERNNDRLPTFHRLDFSWTIHNFRREQRKWIGEWVFTVYNIYGRNNAYNVFFQPRDANTPPLGIFSGSPFAAYRLSVFGAPVVSLTYKFTFLP
jgi:outer membrane receptor protein involved in Fe transport